MPKLDQETQRARRGHILNAAETCFCRNGFHQTSIQDICKEAGVSPGALYIYFSSKEDLIAGLCEREMENFAAGLAVIADAPDFMAGLKALAETYCVHQPADKCRLQMEINAEAIRNPAINQIVSKIDSFLLQSFERLIHQAHQEGRIDPEIDAAVISQVIAIIGDGICLQRALNPNLNVTTILPVILSLLSSMIRPAAKLSMPEATKPREDMRQSPIKLASLAAGIFLQTLAGFTMLTAGSVPANAQQQAEITKEGASVSVIRVRPSAFAEKILVTGSLIARQEVLVSPQIDGYRITELLVEAGDRVKEGQVLAKLSSDTLLAQLAQQKASLNKAEAAIAQAQSRIVEGEATKKQAEAAFERAKELMASKTISKSIFDEREAAARTAAAASASAKDGLRVVEADKQQVEAQIRELQVRLSYTEIKAPSAGLVSARNARLGAIASSASEALFRIIADGEIELEAEVPEVYLPRLSTNMTATIEVAGLKARQGTVRIISPEVDRSTRLGKVRIFIGDDPQLRVGTFGRAEIEIAESNGLAVPSTAVLYREGGAVVQVVDESGKVESRKVNTGLMGDAQIEIVDGLKPDEMVVVRSGTLLREGDSVRPILNEATAATAISETRQ